MVLRALMAALGAWRVEPARAVVLYRRINGTLSRIERMLVRFRAGRLWRVTQRVAVPGRRVCHKAGVRLPRRFGWLVQLGGYQAAGFGSQLHSVINTPEMAELLAASAQAGRVLRPLCRALAVKLPMVSGAVTTDMVETKRRRRRPRAELAPFRIALPRGVLVAARREGFGKDR